MGACYVGVAGLSTGAWPGIFLAFLVVEPVRPNIGASRGLERPGNPGRRLREAPQEQPEGLVEEA